MAQIGFVGLGRMGGNMVTRIKRDSDHDVVAFDRDKEVVKKIAEATGARGANTLKALVKKLDAPRMVWIMVPAGAPTQGTVDKLAELLDKGDMIIDGGNSKWTDDKARAAVLKTGRDRLPRRRHERRRVGPRRRLLHDGRRAQAGGEAARRRSSTSSRRRRTS